MYVTHHGHDAVGNSFQEQNENFQLPCSPPDGL